MHFKKIEEKKKSLDNIYLRVNNEKNILLIEIMKLSKKLQFYVKNALSNKHLISQLKTEYSVKNKFIQNRNILNNPFSKKIKLLFVKPKQLWIYLTEEQKHSTDSYTRYEQMILKNIKKNESEFVLIGDRAIEFGKNNKLQIIRQYTSEQRNQNLENELAFLVKYLYADGNYESVRFVISSNKNFKDAFTILPLEKFDVYKFTNTNELIENINVKDYLIFPDLQTFIDSEINMFLTNSIHALMIESYFYNAKNKLITTNQIIKQLDEDILKLSKKIIKFKREKEIEDIVMFFRKNKKTSEDA